MTLHPRHGWDHWLPSEVFAAVVQLLPCPVMPRCRGRDMCRAREQYIGAVWTYAGWLLYWGEAGEAMGGASHNTMHSCWTRWLRWPRAKREDWLFKVLVELVRRERLRVEVPMRRR